MERAGRPRRSARDRAPRMDRRRSRPPRGPVHRGRCRASVASSSPASKTGRLRQVPLLLEDVAIRLDEVSPRPDRLGDPGKDRPVDLAQPALGRDIRIDGRAGLPFEPGAVLVEVVEEQASLALERPNLRVVLPPADAERHLSQRVEGSIGDQNSDRVAGRTDWHLAEREVGRPLGELRLPGQLDERDRRVAEA